MIEDVTRWLEDDLLALDEEHDCEEYEGECLACDKLICWACEPTHADQDYNYGEDEDDDAIEW